VSIAPPNLQQLQQLFLAAINDDDARAVLAQHLVSHGKLSSIDRIQTYRDSIQTALFHCLQETYPVCEKIVGQDFFLAMAYQYISDNPSRSENLNDYGGTFADFSDNFPAAKGLRYLGDIARLEWARQTAYYRGDSFYGDFSQLSTLDEAILSKVHLMLPPSAIFLAVNYPVTAIWDFAQDEIEQEVPDLAAGGEKLLIWRHHAELNQDKLSEIEWYFLLDCQNGLQLGAVLENLLSRDPTAQVAGLMADCVNRGFLMDFYWGDKNERP